MASSASDILAVIMGGGRGTRLNPLTLVRSKPAVPIAGKYRLIDIPISNSINSTIYRIAILTQFNSVSLHRHISRAYRFDAFHAGWLQIWAAEQTQESADWYQGTADAVRKQLWEIRATEAKYILILAGDHLYRMDYRKMAEFHLDRNADITVAVHPVPLSEAARMGILKCEADGRISEFIEKPQDHETQERLRSSSDPERPLLASMGIYLFNAAVLDRILTYNPRHDDFGNNVIPEAVHTQAVYGFEYDGYWRDIGTIRAYYETNLQLTQSDTPFNFYDPQLPIYTLEDHLPGSIVHNSELTDVLLAEGTRIEDAKISRSVIGLRSQIAAGSNIRDTVLCGSDYYGPGIGIGPACQISGAIIDKNARIGEGVVIEPFPGGTEFSQDNWFVRDGIVVLPKDVEIRAGTRIGPE